MEHPPINLSDEMVDSGPMNPVHRLVRDYGADGPAELYLDFWPTKSDNVCVFLTCFKLLGF